MKLWHRHLVLLGKANREGRIGHRHVWFKCYDLFRDVSFRCFCGKEVSPTQLEATRREDLPSLFMPIHESQADFLLTTQFFRP
jgi:hypothetical protein